MKVSYRNVLITLFAGIIAGPVLAEEANARKWKDTGEVSLVTTNGNSKTMTTSVKNLYEYNWSKETSLQLDAQGMGASSGGTVTAENYKAGEKATRKLFDRNYLYEKFTWDKDRFAGIQNRYDGSVGVGRLLLDLSKDKLKGEIGGGYINEERTNAPRNDYVSGRVYAKYEHILSETAKFTQDGEYLHNFEDSKAYRLNTETALIASMTTHVSLKAGYQWKRNAVPPPGIGRDDTLTSVALIFNY